VLAAVLAAGNAVTSIARATNTIDVSIIGVVETAPLGSVLPVGDEVGVTIHLPHSPVDVVPNVDHYAQFNGTADIFGFYYYPGATLACSGGAVRVANVPPPETPTGWANSDQFTVVAWACTARGDTATGWWLNALGDAEFHLFDATGSVFNGDALPASINLADFSPESFFIFGGGRGRITGVEIVPEPDGLGVVALLALAARRRRAHAVASASTVSATLNDYGLA
jgi:hypothetical protein